MTHRSRIALPLLAVATALMCCSSQPRVLVPPARGATIVTFTRHAGGWDNGPAYRVVLDSLDHATYHGIQNVPVLGWYSTSAPRGTVRQLAERLFASGFPQITSSVPTRSVTCSDVPWWEISLTRGANTVTLADSCGTSAETWRFPALIDSVTGPLPWHWDSAGAT